MRLERISENWWRVPGGMIVVVDGTARRYIGSELVASVDVIDDPETAVCLVAAADVRATPRPVEPVEVVATTALGNLADVAVAVARVVWRVIRWTAIAVVLVLGAAVAVAAGNQRDVQRRRRHDPYRSNRPWWRG